MSSKWTNKYAILRDLSQAQGWVPAKLDCAVEGDQKPPVPNIKEDTEEEFYKNFIADGKGIDTPDLGLIKQMLEVVQGEETEEVATVPYIIEIAKLYPNQATTAVPVDTITNTSVEPKKNKAKSQRNVALASILNTNVEPADKKSKRKNKNIGIEKPAQNIEIENTTNVVKNTIGNKMSPSKSLIPSVTISLQSKAELQVKLKPRVLNFDYKNMFKKKTGTETVTVPKKKTIERNGNGVNIHQYVPSEWANDYYNTMLERANMRDEVREDIWSRAARKMREIDEKRRQEAALLEFQKNITENTPIEIQTSSETVSPPTTEDTQSQSSDMTSEITENETSDNCKTNESKINSIENTDEVNTSDKNETIETKNDVILDVVKIEAPTVEELVQMEAKKLDVVRLPLYRHLLTGECAVCLARERYNSYLKGVKDTETADTDDSFTAINDLEEAENKKNIIDHLAEDKDETFEVDDVLKETYENAYVKDKGAKVKTVDENAYVKDKGAKVKTVENSTLNPACAEFIPTGFYLDDEAMDVLL